VADTDPREEYFRRRDPKIELGGLSATKERSHRAPKPHNSELNVIRRQGRRIQRQIRGRGWEGKKDLSTTRLSSGLGRSG